MGVRRKMVDVRVEVIAELQLPKEETTRGMKNGLIRYTSASTTLIVLHFRFRSLKSGLVIILPGKYFFFNVEQQYHVV